jgi:hypothetical protein
MHPFVAILGIVAGSLVSLAFGLAVVLLVFWLLQDDHPRFAAELPEVARGFATFFVLAMLAAAAFLGTVKQRAWRYPPLTLLWGGLLATGWYYWPD